MSAGWEKVLLIDPWSSEVVRAHSWVGTHVLGFRVIRWSELSLVCDFRKVN